MTATRERCPICGHRSTNSHDPMKSPKLLRCRCGNRWHEPRYIQTPKPKRKAVT